MTNTEIYKKTLGFSVRRMLWDILAVLGAVVLTGAAFWIAEKTSDKGLIGLAVGFYDGFFGPGTGTILILLFTTLLGMDMVTASATAKPVNLASNLASVVTRIAAGNVLFALAIPATVCSALGGWLGARLALTKGARFIRGVMVAVLALLTVKLAMESLG